MHSPSMIKITRIKGKLVASAKKPICRSKGERNTVDDSHIVHILESPVSKVVHIQKEKGILTGHGHRHLVRKRVHDNCKEAEDYGDHLG